MHVEYVHKRKEKAKVKINENNEWTDLDQIWNLFALEK